MRHHQSADVLTTESGTDAEAIRTGEMVVFELWIDGVRKAAVGTGGVECLDVDVTGGQRMEPRVTDAGDGVGSDHGDGADGLLTRLGTRLR
jgi:beta-galactosidase